MRRPAVLHVVGRWVEGDPVVETVRSTTATRAVVVAAEPAAPGARHLPSPAALAALALRERVAVVHCHDPQVAGAALEVARRRRRPLGLSLGAEAYPPEVLAAADLVVVPREADVEPAVSAGAARARVVVVPPGLDLGRTTYRERVLPTDRPPSVTVLGPPDEALGAALPGVRLRFLADDEQVRRVLADTDLLVARGRPVLEALAAGALVVTDDDLPADVALHAAGTPAVADAVRTLLGDPYGWPRRSRAGRAHVAAAHELGSRVADLDRLWCALADGSGERWVPAVPATRPTTRVVLVTHDRRDLLDRTLDALARQTLPPDEVVVVDNGCADGTDALLADRVRRQDPPGLTVLTRTANYPVAEGRNLAAAGSTQDLLVFTDDDCRPRPTWLECLVAGMREGVDLVQGQTVADPEQPLERLSRTQWTPAEFGLYETCNVAYRRSAFERVGGFDLHLAEEVARTLGARWARYPFGEDTDLGWRVKRSGSRSAFAVHAVVEHEVSPPDDALLLRRASLSAAFPLLVRRVPELRRTFLTGGVLLGRRRAKVWAAVAGTAVAAATTSPLPLLAALPYLDDLVGLREFHRRVGRRARLHQGWVLARRDAIETAALLRGSLRARGVVL